MRLDDIVRRSAERFPTAVAVKGPDETLTYGQLDALANRVARALLELGVQRGDRVGLWTEKSARAVAAMQGIARLGAAYVPLDPHSPASRTLRIVEDCGIQVVVTSASRAGDLSAEGRAPPRLLLVDDAGPGFAWGQLSACSAEPVPPHALEEDALAYILYTSGSTGTPKGVCISHRNALAFIEWCHALLATTPEDRFSNHAPFYFDLSVLDLYAAFLGGASVTLIPEALAFAPRKLVEFVQSERFTVWYSVPSALILMMREGGLLEHADLPFRAVLFAGEPFPIKHLRPLREHLPRARHFNLYGPTETNVCTFHEVTDIAPERAEPVPIGRASCGDRVWLARAEGEEFGELMVEGPTVMRGYWGHPPQGARPYATGDLCRELPDGAFEYVGRRDSMLKVRGRRIEPGEIEAALLTHPDIQAVGVVARGSGLEARLVACVVSARPPSLLQLKKHCAERVPRYMIVDEVRVMPELPRTQNGKLDRRALTERVQRPSAED
ncbi:D-alanine--poly(phosphoribitol) ligase [Corallococcus sp. H22C18031201]|uniref:amino acid adenylation domain-containing protein n=1 Tax=Citreicoccus inhibens TaxID=2849499 RepID=UPI000E72D87A|nr:amino acid adenylation domain-containing protein [Citreicoccus inhibens]MBU8897900.1 amino acid adenylation domain-containing protein [Citreicoccus inhibens]RJS17017.1 D-alanine--poly(phosphoribitol) ligase [Corallococcus sp. H22C18031201]